MNSEYSITFTIDEDNYDPEKVVKDLEQAMAKWDLPSILVTLDVHECIPLLEEGSNIFLNRHA